MGIQGLNSLMDTHFTGWEKEKIEGNIIIDGSSLKFSLYDTDWMHGGQYPEYRSKIRRFFQAMTKSKIIPIVVMDGAKVDEKKRDVKLGRRKGYLESVAKYCRGENNTTEKVLPPLALQVFLMELQELGKDLVLVFADGEGDDAIYRLANEVKCHVLSYDSDFFMYELKKGYIPYTKLKWEGVSEVEANVYYHSKFFPKEIKKDPLLHLVIPAILGNDFIPSIDDANFTYMAIAIGLDRKDRRTKIEILFEFIQTSRHSSFIDFTNDNSLCSENSGTKMLENCSNAEKKYISDETLKLEDMKEHKSISLHCSSRGLQSWLLNLYTSGKFLTMNILINRRNILSVFVDDTAKPTCTECSKPIRQFMYGLMGLSEVTEHRREGELLKPDVVKASTELDNGSKILQFESIPTALEKEKAENLYSILLGCSNSEPTFEKLVDKKWFLAIAATKFWIKQCQPDDFAVKALIRCFVIVTTHIDVLPKLNRVQFLHSTQQWKNLMHIFSSWQCCYGDAFRLNQILGMPLKPVSPAYIFDGSLLMYLVSIGSLINLHERDSNTEDYTKLYDIIVIH